MAGVLVIEEVNVSDGEKILVTLSNGRMLTLSLEQMLDLNTTKPTRERRISD